MKKHVVGAAVALALTAPVGITLTALTTTSADAVGTFSSCSALNRVYAHGVAKSARAAQRQVNQGNYRPASGPRAQRVYWANYTRLDRDRDGTACEN